MAMLYYALMRGLRRTLPMFTLRSLAYRLMFFKLRDNIEREISSLVRKKLLKIENESTYTIFEKYYLSILNKQINNIAKTELKREIERIFSSKITDLIKSGTKDSKIRLEIISEIASLSCNISLLPSEETNIRIELKTLNKEKLLKEIRKASSSHIRKPRKKSAQKLAYQVSDIADHYLENLTSIFRNEIHYLPASRAGILHSYRTVAGAIISLAPLAPIRGAEIPKIPGPIADFLSDLIEIGPEETGQSENVNLSREFEKEILEGETKLTKEIPEAPPSLAYKFDEHEISIARTSSMIAELAPLNLYLKYGKIKRGDTIIIEEPEAHLHPDKLAKLAKLIAQLINQLDLTIIITTHSDVLLAKLSNLTSLSGLPSKELEKLGYKEEETIKPKDVAVYNFHKEKDHIIIEPIKVTYEGIPDDTFRKIIEELYEETMNIYYRIQELKTQRGI